MRLWTVVLFVCWMKSSSAKDATTAPEGRIVGGQGALLGEYPFYVQYGVPLRCGGTLIHEDIVLSAAHCNDIQTTDLIVGAYQLNNPNIGGSDGQGAFTRTIVQRRLHPDWDNAGRLSDYLVLKLNEPIPGAVEEGGIDPAPLPACCNRRPRANEDLTIIGLGRTTEGGTLPNTLQEASVLTVPDRTCEVIYENAGVLINRAVQFCAGVPQGGIDSCQGDSGGPILDVNNTILGITSGGVGCARPFIPGFYARVTGALQWIQESICFMAENPPDSCRPDPESQAREVRIKFTYDTRPLETGWQIVSNSGAVVVDWPTGSFAQPGVVEHTLYLLPGSYELRIVDVGANGICCLLGFGFVQVVLPEAYGEDTVVATSDGRFRSSEVVEFDVAEFVCGEFGSVCDLGRQCCSGRCFEASCLRSRPENGKADQKRGRGGGNRQSRLRGGD